MKRNATLCVLLAATAVGLALAGCDRTPETALPAPVGPDAIGYGPGVEALPAGAPAPIGAYAPAEGYRWAEDAYYLNYAFEDAEPDYVYAWNGIEPWAWRSVNGWYRIVEPLVAGDRYYYYRPDSDYPFFVVDDGYGYGFEDGRLVAVYDPAGRLMSRDYLLTRADYGGRYLRRGHDLYAARAAATEIALDQTRWERRQARLAAETARLAQAALAQPDWRAYRTRVDSLDTAERAALSVERMRRRDAREARRDIRRELREARREARRDVRDALPPPGVVPPQSSPPRRDDNPGVAKRSPRANEVHARNAARKAARDAERAERRRIKDQERALREAEREAERY